MTKDQRIHALCKELERTNAELEAWHSAFGTQQLSHAIAQLEAAKAKLECAELHKWVAMCEESRLGIVLPLPPKVQELKDALDKAEAENARLQEQLKDYCVNHATICYQCGKPDGFGELLNGAIDELVRLRDVVGECDAQLIDERLTRLRAVMEGKT